MLVKARVQIATKQLIFHGFSFLVNSVKIVFLFNNALDAVLASPLFNKIALFKNHLMAGS